MGDEQFEIKYSFYLLFSFRTDISDCSLAMAGKTLPGK